MMKTEDLLRKSWLLCFLLLGAGQILPFDWWYFKGISLGDDLFLILFFVEMFFFITANDLRKTLSQIRFMLMSIGLIVVALGLGVALNYQKYINFRLEYLFSILRLVYFALVVFMAANVVARRLSIDRVLKFYLMGLAAALLLNVLEDFIWNVPNERCGLYIWNNPNVIGNIACIGLLYMAIWLKEGARPYAGYVAMFLLLSYSILISFSKASWIMLALANILLLIVSWRSISLKKRGGYAGLVAIAIWGSLVSLQLDKVTCYAGLKIKSSPPSLEVRQNYAVSAIDILMKNPMGIGVGRYFEFVTGSSVSEREGAQVGYSSAGNPHSAILHLMISGGWAALLGMGFLVSAIAQAFWRATDLLLPRKLGALVFILIGSILLVSASFQLQIITQNFIYVLSGTLLATRWKNANQRNANTEI